MSSEKKIGLALSGGGFRAAAFHLGTLRKLNELGVLKQVKIISTISGGAIAGTYYVLKKENFADFEASFKNCLKKNVITIIAFPLIFLLTVYGYLVVLAYQLLHNYYWWRLIVPITMIVLFLILQFLFFPITKLKIFAYEWIFFGDKKLKDLPQTPELAINATNLETGTLWTFSKRKVSDSSYEYPKDNGNSILFKAAEFPASLAVACSTCVPFPFNPIRISKRYFLKKDDYKKVKPLLVDGGLYDNQGIHKLTQKNSSYACDIIVVSDGSQPFSFTYTGYNSISVLRRANDVMMRKIKSMQFLRDVYSSAFEIAYFSLDWEYEKCIGGFVHSLNNGKISDNILLHHKIPSDWVANTKAHYADIINLLKQNINFEKITSGGLSDDEIRFISKIGTSLSALSDRQINCLSKHAAVLTELQIKLYCPSLNSNHEHN